MRMVYPLASMAGVVLLDVCIAAWDLRAAQDMMPEEIPSDRGSETARQDGTLRSADLPMAQGTAMVRIPGGAICLAAGVLGGVLVLAQAVGFNRVYLSKYACNYADQLRSLQAGQMIAEYEQSTGNVITKVAFYRDANPTYQQYPGLYHNGDMVVSSYCETWSDLVALNYYLGTDYERGEEDPDYAAMFASQDWDQYSNEQVILDGDTMHYCVY